MIDNDQNEELVIEKQKEIINQIINTLNQDELYYTDSNSISRIIHDEMNSGKLSKEDFEIVQKLSPSDIHVLLSYKSGCC